MARDWLRFRGGDGAGVGDAPGLGDAPEIRWKTALPGEGHSSPVVHRGRLYVTSADEGKGRRALHCLDAATGAIRWSTPVDFSRYHTHEFNTAASSTPAVDGDGVYCLWPSPERFEVVAVGHDGKPKWRRDLGAFPTQHGGASSPVVEQGRLIFGAEPENADGALYALDTKTGETRWKVARSSGPAPYVAPLLRRPKGGPVEAIFASTAHGITAVDVARGAVLWEVRDLFKLRCVGSPILAGGLVVATTGEGGGSRLAVAVDPAARKVVWRLTRGTSYVPTPIAVDDRLYFWGDGGILACCDPATGATRWAERVGGKFFGSPVRAGGALWAASAEGDLVAVDAGPKFALRAKIPLGEPSHATPAVADGVLFLRTRSHVLAFGPRRAATKP